MFDSKEVPCLESNKFVKINKTIEEDPDLGVMLSQLLESEVALERRFDHVIHLTEQVNKENRLVIQIFQSMDLFFIKVFHFIRSDHSITVQVN